MNIDFSRSVDRLQSMSNYFMVLLPGLLFGVIVFFIFYWIGKGIRAAVQRVHLRRRRRSLGEVLGRLAQGGTIVLGFLLAATVAFPQFTMGDLVGVLGLGSVAVGFAFRDVLQNYLAGILLLLTEPFRIGDQIIFKEFEGTVEDVETRATFIRTYDGRRVVIPNAELFTNSVLVNTAFEKRRTQADIGIGVSDDIERAKGLMLETVRGIDGVLRDPPPEAFVMELADYSVKIRVWWWTEPPQRVNILDVQGRALTAIKQALTSSGIDLPYPTQQVLFHDQTEEIDGDRSRQREGWPAGGSEAPRPLTIAQAIGGSMHAHHADGGDRR